MNEIRLLPKSVSSKIAAGEVVERPLSVVKELVENAIDAEAGAVSIDIREGGISEICVTDNGCGIAAPFVQTAFEKHATSKIFTEADLGCISTQGFRGEALFSIAAVSVVEMKTKAREEEIGSLIRVSGGRFGECEPAGLPDGTSVCVKNLFFNMPARLKFLKRPAQEAAAVTDLVSRYILAYPEIAFHYRAQGNTIYHSPGSGSLQDAIYTVYGGAIVDTLAHVSGTVGEISVSGYVSRPGTVMKNRRAGSVFVNRRYVRSTALHDMVRGAYGQTLVKGEFPFFALGISLPSSSVDVNVHPNKLQVRFKDPASVEHVIREAVSHACRHVSGTVDIGPPQNASQAPKVSMRTAPQFSQQDLFTGFKSTLKETEQAAPPVYAHTAEETASQPVQPIETAETSEPAPETVSAPIAAPQSYRLIGSFGSAYVLVEQGDNLLLIDQHAAHERILFDSFQAKKDTMSQPLLLPEVITLSHEQKNQIDESIEGFRALGFDIEPFGMLEYKVSAVPAVFAGVSVSALLADALFELSQNAGSAVLMRDRVTMAACRSAVKAGDKLPDQALLRLVEQFLETDTIPTCPHGRPVITVITRKQIEKSFKRVL